jgi:hypothetical protein
VISAIGRSVGIAERLPSAPIPNFASLRGIL